MSHDQILSYLLCTKEKAEGTTGRDTYLETDLRWQWFSTLICRSLLRKEFWGWLYIHVVGKALEKAVAPHSSALAWKIPWTEEPGRLQSMGSRRVRHDWATSLSCIGEGNGNPLHCSCLEIPRDGVAQSRTRLKWLSSSRSREGLAPEVGFVLSFSFFKGQAWGTV